MTACVAARTGKLIDQRFLRALSNGERSRMEGHLQSCGHCRERYRRMQLAERVVAHGPDAELDVPSGPEVDRMAESLGLLEPERPRMSFPLLPAFGGFASLAVALIATFFFLRPPAEYVGARGGAAPEVSFSAYAVGKDMRRLESGAAVGGGEHLKLRMSGLDAPATVHVLLVGSDGEVEHVDLGAIEGGSSVTVPGAIALSGLPAGPLVAYLVVAPNFRLDGVRSVAAARAPPEALAARLKGGAVQRLDLVLEDATE